MTDTPRTDAESPNLWVVPAEFAKQLERELAAAIKQRDEARRDACVNIAMLRLRDMYGDDFVTREDALQMAKEIAAERGWDCFGEKEGGGA